MGRRQRMESGAIETGLSDAACRPENLAVTFQCNQAISGEHVRAGTPAFLRTEWLTKWKLSNPRW